MRRKSEKKKITSDVFNDHIAMRIIQDIIKKKSFPFNFLSTEQNVRRRLWKIKIARLRKYRN